MHNGNLFPLVGRLNSTTGAKVFGIMGPQYSLHGFLVEGRVGRRFDPGLLPEARSPGLDACTSDFDTPQHRIRPPVPGRLFFGYEGV
jgi:hypothetical protein